MRTHHIQADDGPRFTEAELARHSVWEPCPCDPIVETVINASGREVLSVAHHRLLVQEKLCDRCAWPSRETVNMVCQACGTDYSGKVGMR